MQARQIYGFRDAGLPRRSRVLRRCCGRIGLCQCGGRGHREEGCRDRHQHAVKSSTVRQTITHPLHPPWANCPGMEQLSVSSVAGFAKARRAFDLATHSVNIWFASECAPNESCYACMQRFIRRRYMGLPAAASATRGNSRQTDFKGPPLQPIARFCHALFLLSVTGKQRSGCSASADVLNLLVTNSGTR